MSRVKSDIDLLHLAQLAELGMTQADIAKELNMSLPNLKLRLKEKKVNEAYRSGLLHIKRDLLASLMDESLHGKGASRVTASKFLLQYLDAEHFTEADFAQRIKDNEPEPKPERTPEELKAMRSFLELHRGREHKAKDGPSAEIDSDDQDLHSRSVTTFFRKADAENTADEDDCSDKAIKDAPTTKLEGGRVALNKAVL